MRNAIHCVGITDPVLLFAVACSALLLWFAAPKLTRIVATIEDPGRQLVWGGSTLLIAIAIACIAPTLLTNALLQLTRGADYRVCAGGIAWLVMAVPAFVGAAAAFRELTEVRRRAE